MNRKDKETDGQINRRSFIKGAAATGALAAIAGAHPAAAVKSADDKKTAKKSWRDKPDPIDEGLISDGGTFDVVVVGGGTSGVLCARAAAMKGASVAVIENQSEEGCSWAGNDVGTVNSQWIQDHGAPRIDEEEFLREWARRNVIRHNPKRARYFAKNSGRIFDFVIKEMSKEWLEENTHVMSWPPKPGVLLDVSGWKFYYGTTRFGKMTDTTSSVRWGEVMKNHQKKSMTEGAKWFFEHHAEICDIDGSGAVTGLVAKRGDGKYFRFKARKAVALCAGDFSGNREMVIDILDQLRNTAEAMGDIDLVKTSATRPYVRDGSGIKLGVWAGGHVEIGPRSFLGNGEPVTGRWHLQLDSYGERFCDEAVGTTLSQPKGGVIVTLHDANWRNVLEMMPPHHGSPDTAHTVEWPARLGQLDDIKPGPPPENGKDAMSQGGGALKETIYCANTIEELIDYTGCFEGETRKKALAEIARYNEMCETGVDEDFGKDPRVMKVTALKDPPFYANVNRRGRVGIFEDTSPGLCATTGLDTDADGRVLNSEFKPIKGLYAAGNNAGNRFAIVYQGPFSGTSLGMAMTEGYMLGERLAEM